MLVSIESKWSEELSNKGLVWVLEMGLELPGSPACAARNIA